MCAGEAWDELQDQRCAFHAEIEKMQDVELRTRAEGAEEALRALPQEHSVGRDLGAVGPLEKAAPEKAGPAEPLEKARSPEMAPSRFAKYRGVCSVQRRKERRVKDPKIRALYD